MTEIYDLKIQFDEGIKRAAIVLNSGGIVAFPTETVYGLGAVATDAGAVEKIFIAKGRPQDNPLIVHVCSIGQARGYVSEFTETAKKLAVAFWPGPLTLIQKSNGIIPKIVTAGLDTVGFRMPDNRAALELIKLCGPLAAPSANRSGRPSPVTAQHVIEDLYGRVPVILDGGECRYSYESTVVDATGEYPVILRPGGITREQILAVCTRCEVAKGVFEQVNGSAASPGMLHRHYAPRGHVTLVLRGEGQIEKINSLYDGADNAVIVASAKNLDAYGDRECIGIEKSMASGLFSALREADRRGKTEIIIEGTDYAGSGLAFMNRAIRAAGFNLVEP